MNRSRQAQWWLVFYAAGQLMIFPLSAENSTNAPAPAKLLSAPPDILPPLPPSQPPVDFFRELLAMSPRDRENFLTNKPPEIRARILDKVGEYQALDPDERELRLFATELRWYLTLLLRTAPAHRAAGLAQVPDNMRELVKSRLLQWDILPPPIQQEFLENERALHYFAHVDPTNNSGALSEDKRQQISAQFNRFFELTPAEKQKTLNTLSETERAQMEKTLQSFDKLPPAQRIECIHAYTQFASMNPGERAEFLKNAARWSQMSPKERQAWRDLVAHVPQWPPLPPGLMPPLPVPVMPPNFHPAAATNHN